MPRARRSTSDARAAGGPPAAGDADVELGPGTAAGAAGGTAPTRPARTWYGTVLRLRRARLHWLVRALYLEGAAVLGIVLYLANAASAWVILALPAAIAVAVKLYDMVLDATGPPDT